MTDTTTVEDQKSLPILGSEDFRLRPLRLGDEAALLEYLSQPGVIEHTSIPAPTLESLTASVQRDITAYAKSTSFRFAVAASDDRLIGICGFNSWSPAPRAARRLTMRCSEPRPVPMRSFHIVTSFSLQPRALSSAVADLVAR